jgi:hypothetical protein
MMAHGKCQVHIAEEHYATVETCLYEMGLSHRAHLQIFLGSTGAFSDRGGNLGIPL